MAVLIPEFFLDLLQYKVKLLGTILFLLHLIFRIVQQDQNSAQSWANSFSTKVKIEYCTQYPVSHMIFQSGRWGWYFSQLYPVSFPGLGQFSHMHMLIITQLNTLGKQTAGPGVLSLTRLPSAVLCPANSQHLGLQKTVALFPQYWESPGFHCLAL